MKSEQINELAAALAKAQGEFSAVPKDSTNPFFKSSYAALPEVVKTATPVLAKYGLAVSQFISQDDAGHDALMTYLIHSSGQFIAHTMKLHLIKDDPQAQGSAVTYARRYSYMAALGLVADVDDDGNSASQPQQRQSAPAAKPQYEAKPGAITPAQSKALYAILKGRGKEIKAEVIERWGKAEKELTALEASAWIDELNASVPEGHENF
jgi:hypothetical protein